jgi:hypothetical protein
MLLFELGVLPLEALQLRDLTGGPCRGRFRRATAQASVLHILPPLGEHEWMNLECGGDGLYLNPGLLT